MNKRDVAIGRRRIFPFLRHVLCRFMYIDFPRYIPPVLFVCKFTMKKHIITHIKKTSLWNWKNWSTNTWSTYISIVVILEVTIIMDKGIWESKIYPKFRISTRKSSCLIIVTITTVFFGGGISCKTVKYYFYRHVGCG